MRNVAMQGYVEYVIGTNRVMIVDTESDYASLVPLPPARLPTLPGVHSPVAPVVSLAVQPCAAVCAASAAVCTAQALSRINTCAELQRYQVGCRSCALDGSGTFGSPYIGARHACFVVPHRHLSCYRAPSLARGPGATALATAASAALCSCT